MTTRGARPPLEIFQTSQVAKRQLAKARRFFPKIPPRPFVTVLVPRICPLPTLLSSPVTAPPTIPPTSGTNFGSGVVPSIANGIPPFPLAAPANADNPPTIPLCRLASILKDNAPCGLTVPAPRITPMAGTLRLMLSAFLPSGVPRALRLAFSIVVCGLRLTCRYQKIGTTNGGTSPGTHFNNKAHVSEQASQSPERGG
jgi:hypothetical protein